MSKDGEDRERIQKKCPAVKNVQTIGETKVKMSNNRAAYTCNNVISPL